MLRRLSCAAAVTLSVGLAAACGSGPADHRSAAEIAAERSATAAPPTVAATVHPVSMVALGDSFTIGTATAGTGTAGWAQQVAAHFGWHVTVLGKPLMAYSPPVANVTAYSTYVPQIIAMRPQVIVVWDATGDVKGNPTAQVQSAAAGVLQALHLALPQTSILVVGPVLLGTDREKEVRPVISAEKNAAKAADVVFDDTVDGEWFTTPGYLDPQGTGPTNVGLSHVAALIEAQLLALGTPARASLAAGNVPHPTTSTSATPTASTTAATTAATTAHPTTSTTAPATTPAAGSAATSASTAAAPTTTAP